MRQQHVEALKLLVEEIELRLSMLNELFFQKESSEEAKQVLLEHEMLTKRRDEATKLIEKFKNEL